MQLTQVALLALLTGAAISTGDQPVTIRADVNLVQVHARVTDGDGRVVSGLGKDAFRLFIDNVEQPITVFQGEDAPVTAGIVIDNSASMGPKREEVIAAALAFARTSNPKDQMFVVHFNDRARFGLPESTPFTGDVSELETAIAAFDLGGTTALYDALMMAESHFRKAVYPLKVLLTITDGGDNSSRATLTEVTDGALKSGIVVYSVGIFDENDRYRNPQVLSKLAGQTGGEALFPEKISDVTKICVGIAQGIRQRYMLGFAGADDGQYHTIRLTATKPSLGPLDVKTRSGYIAAKSSNTAVQK